MNLETVAALHEMTLVRIWWRVLVGKWNLAQIVLKQQSLVWELECALTAEKKFAARVVHKLEQAIIEHGNTNLSPKTLRHTMLKILDDTYHSKKDSE